MTAAKTVQSRNVTNLTSNNPINTTQDTDFWPRALRIWFWIQILVLTFDASFVLGRPYTFADGPLGWMYPAFQLYATIDTVYGDMTNPFGYAMSTCCLIENLLLSIAMFKLYPNDKRTQSTTITRQYMQYSDYLSLGVVCMQISKTFFYFLNDGYSGFAHVKHNTWGQLIPMFIIPNGIWFVGPFAIMYFYYVPKIIRTVNAVRTLNVGQHNKCA